MSSRLPMVLPVVVSSAFAFEGPAGQAGRPAGVSPIEIGPAAGLEDPDRPIADLAAPTALEMLD